MPPGLTLASHPGLCAGWSVQRGSPAVAPGRLESAPVSAKRLGLAAVQGLHAATAPLQI